MSKTIDEPNRHLPYATAGTTLSKCEPVWVSRITTGTGLLTLSVVLSCAASAAGLIARFYDTPTEKFYNLSGSLLFASAVSLPGSWLVSVAGRQAETETDYRGMALRLMVVVAAVLHLQSWAGFNQGTIQSSAWLIAAVAIAWLPLSILHRIFVRVGDSAIAKQALFASIIWPAVTAAWCLISYDWSQVGTPTVDESTTRVVYAVEFTASIFVGYVYYACWQHLRRALDVPL